MSVTSARAPIVQWERDAPADWCLRDVDDYRAAMLYAAWRGIPDDAIQRIWVCWRMEMASERAKWADVLSRAGEMRWDHQ